VLAAPKGSNDVSRLRGAVFAAVLLAASVAIGAAPPTVRLTFKEGLVWLSATDATAAQILAEWSRVGGTRIVNAERISGPPLKLELNGVLEMDALEILLRTTGGFIAAARVPAAKDGSPISGVEQITLLPVNSRPMVQAPQEAPVPAPDAAPPPPVSDPSGARRVLGPDGQPVPDDQDGAPHSPEAPQAPPPQPPPPTPPR
jgi:hypothetical protein